VAHKLMFTADFTAPIVAHRFASSVVTPWGYKAGGRSYATYILLHDLPSSTRFLPYC
jgi:hypothetical protein